MNMRRESTVMAAAATFWWLVAVARIASSDSDFWDCNSGFDYVINGAWAAGMVLVGWTLVILARQQSRRWLRVSQFGCLGAVTSAVANSLEHCAQASLGLPYVIGLLATLIVCIALGVRLLLGLPRVWAGAGLIVAGVAPFPLADDNAWGLAVGLTITTILFVARGRDGGRGEAS